MKLKRMTAMFMVFFLVLPSLLVSAEKNESSSEEEISKEKGSYSAKHEVVYATLDPSGAQEEMYVVNNFDVQEPGKIIDHGPYTSVKNLTNLMEIKQSEERIELTAKEEEFYYQGNLEGKPLPWNINVSYKLDGKNVQPESLLGQNGKLEIEIDTKRNKKADVAFFNNYLLQITLQLDSKIYENIKAPDGTIANAGKDRRVTFTVMPENEGHFAVNANVTDLEMEGIEFAAIPSSMSIGAPDVGGMKKDMNSLSDATEEINNGVGQLQQGIEELDNGVVSLYNGSEQYRNGLNELSNGSSQLIEGSASIEEALQQMSNSVGEGSGDMNLNDIKRMEDGLRQIADGLKESSNGLTNLKNQYGKAHQTLSQAMEAIPNYEISKADIQALQESGADKKVIGQLVETYEAARVAKGTYANVKQAFNAVSPALEKSAGSLDEMSASLNTMADQVGNSLDNMDMDESLKQLQQGLKKMSSKYNDFHAGLKDYTGGVAELANSYGELHGGIAQLTNGTSELENGAAELHEGTSELASSTSDLPEQMQKEIDQMIDEFDKSDFDAVSFVSSENKKVESVQFVIKTESVKKDGEEQDKQKKEEEKSFWDRLLDLFR